MTVTITDGSDIVEPLLALAAGYKYTSTSGNIGHELLNGGFDVSLAPATLRSGRLELLFATEAEGSAAEALHRAPARLTLTDSERPVASMQYVLAPGGRLALELDDRTLERWVLLVEFQEVR